MFKFIWQDMDLSHKYDEVPRVSSDREFKRHYHNFYEIFYFISGTAMYTVENEKRLLKPHDALIIRPGEFHYVEFLDKTPYERYVLKLPVGHMVPYLAEKLKNRSAFFPNQENALELFASLDKAYETYSGDDMFCYASGIIVQAVICLCNSSEQTLNDSNLANTKILPIIQYINDNLDQPLTLTDIADKFQYSADYLNREFYRYMKTSIMKYVRTKRVYEAHKLILGGAKPTQVAERLGYTEYSSFYRSYKAIIGKAPSEKDVEKSSTSFEDQ